MTELNREEFLRHLELVQPGLSAQDMLGQSNCFLFEKKQIVTFNDEIYCSIKTKRLPFEGAVRAIPLLELLRKMDDETVSITAEDNQIIVKGANRSGVRAGIKLEKEISENFNLVDTAPKEWHKLPDYFTDAISIVHQCAGKDVNDAYSVTCVHFTPKWVEAFDNLQFARHKMKMGIDKNLLVPKNSIKHVIPIGPVEYGLTDSWIHFRSPDKLILSCRLHNGRYPSFKDILEFDGEEIILPRGLKNAVERAEIFSAENSEENVVSVTLAEGEILVKGEGNAGWFKQKMRSKYSGRDLGFNIYPYLLKDIIQKRKGNEIQCEVSESKLRIKSSAWVYLTVLEKKEESK